MLHARASHRLFYMREYNRFPIWAPDKLLRNLPWKGGVCRIVPQTTPRVLTLVVSTSHGFYNLRLGAMTCIPIKQVYRRISMVAETISSYLRPSTPNPISPELSILRLPQEVIDVIVDELGSRFTLNFNTLGFQTLQNCALTSRLFRFRATRWVFFRVRFEGRWRDTMWINKRVEGFLKLLIANPSIGGSVRELFIKSSQRNFDFWLQDNPSLVSILGRLSQIQRVDLRYDYGMQPINWTTLPWNTATALRCTMQSPSIRFLELHDIDEFPWFILAGCSTLKGLAISRVLASHRHVIVPSAIPPMLESLYIINAYSTVESLLSNPITAGMFSQLRILSVDFNLPKETRAAARFIIKVAQTLETLNIISLSGEFSTYYKPFLLGIELKP